ncbi:MAG: L-threonylcarbamoyladenylate synthase [Chloroflexia bacterium]
MPATTEIVSAIKPAVSPNWEEAAEAVRAGGVVAFPTDTVYGIGCNPFDVSAIRAIYRLKGRSSTKALPLLLSGPDQLVRVAKRLTPSASLLGSRFWPGALTIVIGRNLDLPPELSGDDTIAVRVPNHEQLRAFLAACGGFLAVTSANPSGQPDARSAQEVAAYFPSGLALVVAGGRSPGGRPSTVIDCSKEETVLLRHGAISLDNIEQALERQVTERHVQD